MSTGEREQHHKAALELKAQVLNTGRLTSLEDPAVVEFYSEFFTAAVLTRLGTSVLSEVTPFDPHVAMRTKLRENGLNPKAENAEQWPANNVILCPTPVDIQTVTFTRGIGKDFTVQDDLLLVTVWPTEGEKRAIILQQGEGEQYKITEIVEGKMIVPSFEERIFRRGKKPKPGEQQFFHHETYWFVTPPKSERPKRKSPSRFPLPGVEDQVPIIPPRRRTPYLPPRPHVD